MARHQNSLTELARLGFADLDEASSLLADVSTWHPTAELLPFFAAAADPDLALRQLHRLWSKFSAPVAALVSDSAAAGRLIRVLGASTGLAEFLHRNPAEIGCLSDPLRAPLTAAGYREDLLAAVADTVDLADRKSVV